MVKLLEWVSDGWATRAIQRVMTGIGAFALHLVPGTYRVYVFMGGDNQTLAGMAQFVASMY
jgi:hypothetical protein